MPLCEFLPWDTEFFCQRIGRAVVHRLDADTLEAILEWCKVHAINCLYFLADSDHAQTVQLLGDSGFRLVDIRVVLEREVDALGCESRQFLLNTVRLRRSTENDIALLQEVARTSYTDSRFYYDSGFSAEQCEAFYKTWIKKSCEGYADIVLVIESDSRPIGYVTCHLMSKEHRGQIGLVGLAPEARGRGLARLLLAHSIDWFAQQRAEFVSVVTQGRNVAAQRLYQHCGFLTRSVGLWYHKRFP